MQLFKNFEATWIDFGKALPSQLDSSWHQLAPKPDPKTNPANCNFLESLLIKSGGILNPNLRPREGVDRCHFKRLLLALGAFLQPRWPQEALQETSRTTSKTDFEAALVVFLFVFFVTF